MSYIRLSLTELDASDPHPTCRGPERRYFCSLSPECQAKSHSRSHQSLCVNVETGFWQCQRCGSKGKLLESQTSTPTAYSKRNHSFLGHVFDHAPPAIKKPSDPHDGWRRKLRHALQPLAGSPGGAYLRQRGIPLELAFEAQVRYCRCWEHWEQGTDGKWQLLGASRRIVFPVYAEHPRTLVGIQARSISPSDDYNAAKLSRGNVSLGVFATPGAWGSECIALTEAPFDALSLAACGLPSLAVMGTKLPDWLAQALAFRRVFIAPDGDPAGDEAAASWHSELRRRGACGLVRLRPEPKDWNEWLTSSPATLQSFVDHAMTQDFNAGGSSQRPTTLASASLLCPDLAALINRTGRQWQAFDTRAHTWDYARYTRSRDTLSANLDQVTVQLADRSQALEAYGWHIEGIDRWIRTNGEPSPLPMPDPLTACVARTMQQAGAVLCPDAENRTADELNADALARFLRGAPDEWPELVPVEEIMVVAHEAGDLTRLETVCAAYLQACARAQRLISP